METCNRYDEWIWLSYALGHPLEFSVTSELELHCRSCKECAARLDFSRKIAAILDLNAADPPASWIKEAAARFAIMSRKCRIPPNREDV